MVVLSIFCIANLVLHSRPYGIVHAFTAQSQPEARHRQGPGGAAGAGQTSHAGGKAATTKARTPIIACHAMSAWAFASCRSDCRNPKSYGCRRPLRIGGAMVIMLVYSIWLDYDVAGLQTGTGTK